MLTFDEIKQLIYIVEDSSVQELQVEKEGLRVTIRKFHAMEHTRVCEKAPSLAKASSTTQHSISDDHTTDHTETTPDTPLHTIVCPMVGTFYGSSSPDAPPFVEVGSQVQENTTVCIIEAMKLMNELDADIKGEIVQVLVQNGQFVEYGQPLFLVKT